MDNLYEIVQDIKAKREEAYNKYLELRSKMESYGYEPDEEMYEKYDKELDKIEKVCKVDCKKLAKIVSRAKRREYHFVVFREIERNKFEAYATHKYIACFVNNDCKYFNVQHGKNEGIFLYKEDYKELLESLNNDNSMIILQDTDVKIPLDTPYSYLDTINYTKLITRESSDDFRYVSPEFQSKVMPIMEDKFKKSQVGEVEKSVLGV